MAITRTLESQTTYQKVIDHLGSALGGRPYEVRDHVVHIDDGGKSIRLVLHDEPNAHLGSLDLPMEELRFEFEDHSESEADAFMAEYREHTMRAGGG